MALTEELLQSVAAGRDPGTARVFRPGPTVAFGRRDSLEPGFEAASRAARSGGFTPVVRHAGGRAVAYDENSVVVELIRPERHAWGGIEPRFEQMSALLRAALGRVGVELELGELPDEYCPGRFSLHLPGGPKVAGIAQRVIRGASLTNAVLAVGASVRVRAVTVDVYAALGLSLDPQTVGAVADRFPEISVEAVADALAEMALAEGRSRRWRSD